MNRISMAWEKEKLINELIVGEKGKNMKQKINELKNKVEDTRPGGVSYKNLDKIKY